MSCLVPNGAGDGSQKHRAAIGLTRWLSPSPAQQGAGRWQQSNAVGGARGGPGEQHTGRAQCTHSRRGGPPALACPRPSVAVDSGPSPVGSLLPDSLACRDTRSQARRGTQPQDPTTAGVGASWRSTGSALQPLPPHRPETPFPPRGLAWGTPSASQVALAGPVGAFMAPKRPSCPESAAWVLK